ncbi:MAG TPA: winged helix-turn-helix transcriptional regulator [bacterium]|nr:winged helix-turn-helix transcriptional regulator [bacterium]
MQHEDQLILTLLTAIEENPDTTQQELAKKLGSAVGLANSYVKRVIYKGYVKTKQLQRRRLRYLLTPAGIKEKTRLTYEFLRFSYEYILRIRRRVRETLAPFARKGQKSVVFYGSGEVAEIAYLTVRELDMDLAGVVDPNCVGERCVDHVIRDLNWLEHQGSADVLLVLNALPKQTDSERNLVDLASRLKMEYVTCE